jgi:3-oxoacyl-[acyl-carrier-protein] synthase-3
VNDLGCVIAGWGSALPPTLVSNADMESLFDTSDDWIVERSGIRTRRAATGPFVSPIPSSHPFGGLGTTATLAVDAGQRALDSAGLRAGEISLLVLCTTTPDQAIPATSSAVAGALGTAGGAMDLNAACAGFTYGLVTAASLVAAGAGKILLIGAESMTRATNWEDRTSAFLFGDGAGAVVLTPVSGPGSLLGWDLGVDGTLVELLYADHGSGMVMRGKEIFRQAVRATAESANAALKRAQIEASDIALFVPHQANLRIMHAIAGRIGIPTDRIASVIDWTGNTSSASIPLALADAADQDRLQSGDLVLLSGFGAGMTWASAVWRWGGQLLTDDLDQP